MSYEPVNTVLWLDIAVTDLDRAINFYQSLLSIKGRDGRPTSQSASFQLSPNGSGLTLILQKQIHKGGVLPYLNCNGRLEQALTQVKLNGGTVIQDKHTMEPFGVRAVIEDSEKNQIALHSVE
jgi:predicted enzyme related to lactoylglutathione lyase